MEVSYDDGAHWTEVPVAGGKALLNHPASGHVSLRAKVTDTAGNTVDQTIIRAYRLRRVVRGAKGVLEPRFRSTDASDSTTGHSAPHRLRPLTIPQYDLGRRFCVRSVWWGAASVRRLQ